MLCWQAAEKIQAAWGAGEVGERQWWGKGGSSDGFGQGEDWFLSTQRKGNEVAITVPGT